MKRTCSSPVASEELQPGEELLRVPEAQNEALVESGVEWDKSGGNPPKSVRKPPSNESACLEVCVCKNRGSPNR